MSQLKHFKLYSEDSPVQSTSKIDNPIFHWPKPLVWGKWTPSLLHPAKSKFMARLIYRERYESRAHHPLVIEEFVSLS